jgi:hypothetical protein
VSAADDRAQRILAAAKAAFPALWPDEEVENKAGYAFARTDALSVITKAIDAYEAAPTGDTTQVVSLVMPPDAAMVQQTLATVSYLDREGRMAYSVRCIGEGPLSTWLGMGILTQDYLLQQNRIDWKEGEQ